MSRRLLVGWFIFTLAIVLAAPLPVGAQEDAPLAVKGEHVIQVTRGGPDSDVGVIENVRLENEGNAAFSGELWVDLHPEAADLRHYWHNATGAPYPGEPGRVDDAPLETETVGDHVRHRLDLGARNLSLAPGETVILVLQYRIPAEEEVFTRGFTLETPQLRVHVPDVPALRPVSEDRPLEAVRQPTTGNWVYEFAGETDRSFAVGEAFSFTWEPKEEPLEPLAVQIQVTGEDPLELRGVATGGIPEYDYTWDLSGDGRCDDAEGETVQVPEGEGEAQLVTLCVTDNSAPPSEARQTMQARTVVVEGGLEGPSPWLLLVIGLLGGGFLIFALTQGGFIPTAGGRRAVSTGPAYGAESREMLEMRQRVMVAALKELEIAKKKGEVPEDQYTSLKSELKKDTVSVMRELERRKTEKETV